MDRHISTYRKDYNRPVPISQPPQSRTENQASGSEEQQPWSRDSYQRTSQYYYHPGLALAMRTLPQKELLRLIYLDRMNTTYRSDYGGIDPVPETQRFIQGPRQDKPIISRPFHCIDEETFSAGPSSSQEEQQWTARKPDRHPLANRYPLVTNMVRIERTERKKGPPSGGAGAQPSNLGAGPSAQGFTPNFSEYHDTVSRLGSLILRSKNTSHKPSK